MILKYINLTSTNVSLASPIVEVPVGPSATSVLSLGIAPVPSTQEHSPTTPPPTIENNKEFKLYCKNLMMIDSIVFTRSSVKKTCPFSLFSLLFILYLGSQRKPIEKTSKIFR